MEDRREKRKDLVRKDITAFGEVILLSMLDSLVYALEIVIPDNNALWIIKLLPKMPDS